MAARKKKTLPPEQAANVALLDAGALLEPKAKLPSKEPVDPVSGRVYRHPALGDRPVVRLTPDNLAIGDDLGMSLMGFGEPKVVPKLGKQRRRALGFPGWALVNDPKHARYALEVMKEFGKAARRGKSKPGFAKDAFVDIGKRLGRSVPHFLPSYNEEVGRVFIELGNLNYAAQFFGKAREAENVHGLEVDEELRRETFLEFALAGAVTIKSLTAYAKELEKGDPTHAYHHFRELCVRRTLGGMPPWKGMRKDLGRLAKSAGLDEAEERNRFLAEVVSAPCLARAHSSFWTDYREALQAQAATDNAVLQALVGLFPSPSDYPDNWTQTWVELLDEVGAIDFLASGKDQPPEAAAAWFSGLIGRGGTVPELLFGAARRLAKRLKKAKTPVRLQESWGDVDVDFLDLLLELGVPVADPSDHADLDISDWTEHMGDGDDKSPEKGRQLEHVLASSRFEQLVDKSISRYYDSESFHVAAQQVPGLTDRRRKVLEERVANLDTKALPDLESALSSLGDVPAVAWAEFASCHKALGKVDIARALRRTLQCGLIDELGWPELEAALAELQADCKKDEEAGLAGRFPYVIAYSPTRAIVVAPEGRLLEHELRVPKQSQLTSLRYADGQLLVRYRDRNWDCKAYWSSAPRKKVDVGSEWGSPGLERGLAIGLEDGAVNYGGRPLRAGDASVQTNLYLHGDGETWWWGERDDLGDWRLREFDPETGSKGRRSLPKWYEDYAKADMSLDLPRCTLYPLPADLDSPLGSKKGMVGMRIRKATDAEGETTKIECERIDGKRWTGDDDDVIPSALLDLPGHKQPRPITLSYGYYSSGGAIWDPAGFRGSTLASDYRKGSSELLPVDCWHLLTARDTKASGLLRKLSAKAASAWLETALGETPDLDIDTDEDDWDDDDEDEQTVTYDKTEKAIAKALKTRSAGLLAGVTGVVAHAASLSRRLTYLAARSDPDNQPVQISKEKRMSSEELEALFAGLGLGSDEDMIDQIFTVAHFFATGEGKKVPEHDSNWPGLIGRVGGLVFRSMLPMASAGHRAAAARFLGVWQETLFAREPGHCRTYQLSVKKDKLPFRVSGSYWNRSGMGEHKGNRYLVTGRGWNEEEWSVLEYAPKGKFANLPGKLSEISACPDGWGSPEQLAGAIELLSSAEPPEWDPQYVEAITTRCGLNDAEAAILLIGMTNVDSWENNYLPKDVRTALKLKVKEADAARQRFRQMTGDDRLDLYAAAMPDDPAALAGLIGEGPADDKSPFARLGKVCRKPFGKPEGALPADLIAALEKDLTDCPGFYYRDSHGSMLREVNDLKKSKTFTVDGKYYVDKDGDIEVKSKGEHFTGQALIAASVYIPYLYAELPVGDPFRAKMPELLKLVRKRCKNTDLLVQLQRDYFGKELAKGELCSQLQAIGGKDFKPAKASKDVVGRDSGLLVGVQHNWWVRIAMRPAKVKAKDWPLIRQLAEGNATVFALERILSKEYDSLCKRIARTTVPDGHYEANPLLSAPDVVARVAKKHKLTEEAAVLYLQVLTLANPSDKRVQLWNGWKPAQLKAAAKELLDAELLLEAKRSRAGRAHFLPGGWEALKSPLPAIESWKLPLYGLDYDSEGRVHAPLGQILVTAPYHELFEAAWARVESGDAPGYEEVA